MPEPTHHIVRSLYWAKPCPPPPGRGGHATRGSKAQGLSYEKKLGQALAQWPAGAGSAPRIHHGQWFEFCDSGVVRHCQPDFMFRRGGTAVVIEAKLTDTPRAYSQLRGLYFPVLERALGVPVRGVVVCQRVRRDSGQVWAGLEEALAGTGEEDIPLVQWLGRGGSVW